MYKALIFDLGKVLIHFDFQRSYREMEAVCPYPATEIPQRLRPTGLVERFETGLIDPQDFVAELSRILDLNVDYETFCRIFNGIFTDPLIPESMIEGLAARHRMVILSNTNAIHFEMLRKSFPALRHFHDLVLSYEVKAMKPQPEIYRAALDRAGCHPSECFYTDDIAEYVEGARRLGIDAEQFESAEKLERDLHARGIRW